MFAVYLPVYRELGSYEPGFALALSPVPADFFRTLSYAPLETIIRSVLPFRIDSGYEMWVENILIERSYGWSMPAAALWIASFVYTVRKKEKSGKDRMILSSIVSILVLFLLSCRYGGFSPWIHLIARFLPGAGAIRATGRCLGILLIPMTFCICSKVMELEIDREGRKGKIRKYVICGEVIMICFLLLSSQCKRYILEDSDYYRQILAGCEQPPEDCKVFLLVSNNPDAVYSPELQMVAWMIADEWDIRTINGYTGNYPKGWSLAYNNSEEYMINVQNWLVTNGIIDISNVYAYIPEENRWIKYEKIAQDERVFL